jgi:DNA replication protein DnaC
MTSELRASLKELGLYALAKGLDDFLSRGIKARMSPVQVVEAFAALERDDRATKSLISRQKRSRIGEFKPMCDFDWNWPRGLDREGVERALKLRFVDEGASLIIAGAHGLGKTMI